jgi:hypothetical protein
VETEVNHDISISVVNGLAEIRTENLQNTSTECYRYARSIGVAYMLLNQAKICCAELPNFISLIRTKAAGMRFLREVTGCTRAHAIGNERIRNELQIYSTKDKLEESRIEWRDTYCKDG